MTTTTAPTIEEQRARRAEYMRKYRQRRRAENLTRERERKRAYNKTQYEKNKKLLQYARSMMQTT